MPTLEELFGAKQPKNYVQAPPEKVATLEQFFQERTPAPEAPKPVSVPNMFGENFIDRKYTDKGPSLSAEAAKTVAKPVKDEIAEVHAASPKLDQSTIERAKAISMQMQNAGSIPEEAHDPTEQATAAQVTPAQSASNLIDVDRVKQQAETLAPKFSGTDLALGLVPLAVDLFTGGTGAGLDVASKYYLDKGTNLEKRKYTLEDKLMEIERARSVAAAKTGNKGIKTLETVGKDGKPIITRVEDAIGQEAWKKPETDWKAKEAYKAALKEKIEGMKLNAKQKKEMMDREMNLAKDWSKYEFTQNTQKAADAFKRISAIDPYSANPVEDMGAIFDLMKMLDPQSVVRESEQAMAMGARSYGDVINNFESIMSGERKLTAPQVLNIKKFASRLYQLRMKSQGEVDKGFIDTANAYGLDPERVVRKIGSGTPLTWKNSKTGRIDIVVAPPGQEDEYIRLGAQRVK